MKNIRYLHSETILKKMIKQMKSFLDISLQPPNHTNDPHLTSPTVESETKTVQMKQTEMIKQAEVTKEVDSYSPWD